MPAKVFVTRRIESKALDLISSECLMEVYPYDRPMSREELFNAVGNIEGLLCTISDRIDGEVIDNAPFLRMIANYGVGYDNIDIKAATLRGIPVSNTPDVLTDATADLTFGLIISVMRRICEGDRLIRRGEFPKWGPDVFLGSEVHGKILGIFGLGRIGIAVAKRAMAFDMKVIYWSRRPKDLPPSIMAKYVNKEDLLREADCISIHLPLNSETWHFIGLKELRAMKRSAFLINTSRGAIVDEEALVKALREGWIAGAGLDVFENEPVVHPSLIECENVVLCPHIGSATKETRTSMAFLAAKNLIAGLKGEIPPNCVNPEVFSSPSLLQGKDGDM